MRQALTFAALAGSILTAACGSGEETKDGLSAKERSDLDNAAAMLDNQIYDTSPDSLVLDENALDPALPPDNAVAPAGNRSARP